MHHQGEAADGLLAAWTALWHPAILATTAAAPNWYHASAPPNDVAQHLILIPGVSEADIPAGFVERARTDGATVVTGNLSREAIFRQILPPVAAQVDRIDPELAADFLALGYCYLQVELLTRQMRYATNLDEIHFFNQAVAGAEAAAGNEPDRAREQLIACFDLLAQERDHYYAVDAYILDLTLLAPATLGDSVQQLVMQDVPLNLLVTADLLEQMEQMAPETLRAIQHGQSEGHVGLVGGEYVEGRTPLLSCETVLAQLRHGLDSIERRKLARPEVYGRRRFGMSVIQPALLSRLGFNGAIIATLDGGKFPEGSQIKLRWEGPDLTTIDAIGRTPLDASSAETFLGYAGKLGETMDMDHIATICLAHWPTDVSSWYHDLRRVARYSNLLGKFVTANEYFQDSEYPTQLDHFLADQYLSPYLVQAVAQQKADPISTSVRYWQRRTQGEAIQSLQTIASLLGTSKEATLETVSHLIRRVDLAAEQADVPGLDAELADTLAQSIQSVSARIPRGNSAREQGYLVVNPFSLVRRTGLDLPELTGLPAIEKPIYAASESGEHKYVVVDVPPMGVAWIQASGSPPKKAEKRPPQPLAEQHRLYNEFFEAHVNPVTGSLRAVYEYKTRGNRVSQQLALRSVEQSRSDPTRRRTAYSIMAADRVVVTAATPTMGEITAEGRLVDRKGKTVATYRQRYQVWRGSRVLRLKIDLDPLIELGEAPWNSYFGCRLAWPSESASLWRSVNQVRQHAEAKRFEAPLYVEIEDGTRSVTLLTGGLPFHRRSESRVLDSLLVVRGERARSFELGIGIDLKYPVQQAEALLMPCPMIQQPNAIPASGISSWLFHLNSRNVVATHWQPLIDEGIVRGFSVRLLETCGRPARVRIQSFRPVGAACQVDFAGKHLGDCTVEDGVVQISLNANEWVELEARW